MYTKTKLVILLLVCGFNIQTVSAQLPWTENFDSYAANTGIDGNINTGDYPAGVSNWTLNVTAATLATGDYVKTTSGALYFRDVDGPAIWKSSDINISGCTAVQFSIDVSESGDHETADYVDVEYSVDGGTTFTLITNWNSNGSGSHTLIGDRLNGSTNDADWGSETITQTGLSGTDLVLRVTVLNNAGSENIFIDNISVSGTCSAPSTINTGALTGAPYTVNCDVPTTDNGTISFTSVGTFNAGNTFTAQLSDETGSFASPINIGTTSLSGTDPSGNINITIPADAISGAGYLIRIVSDAPTTTGSNSASFTINQAGTCITAITTGLVTGAPFSVNCSGPTSDNGTVAFTATGNYNSGNTFTAQLSNAAGSFASPLNIGTLNLSGFSPSGTINITIPSTMDSGSGYLIRVISDNPSINGTNSTAMIISQSGNCGPTLPASSGLIINEFSNGTTGVEEYYEFVVAGQCGTSVDIRGYILDDNNGTFSNPSNYGSSSTGIAGGHFRFSNDAQWGSIPVGSLIVVYNAGDPNPVVPADDPTDANNDSLYVVPHTSSLFEVCAAFPASSSPDSVYTPCTYTTAALNQWSPLSLRNGGDAIQVRHPDGSYYHGVSYGGNEITGGPNNLKLFNGSGSGMAGWFNDGDFFDASNWSSGSASGNQTPGQANNATNLAWLQMMRDPTSVGCPITVLPVELIDFRGEVTEQGNRLTWRTASEEYSAYFTISQSTDGQNWEEIHTSPAAGNSSTILQYSFIDTRFSEVVNYYRLTQTDFDGTVNTFKKMIALDNRIELDVELIKIVNTIGQEITSDTKGIQIHIYSDGTSYKVYK